MLLAICSICQGSCSNDIKHCSPETTITTPHSLTMNRRRRFFLVIVLFSIAITTIYNSYESVFNFVRLFLPHAGYPLNQDQVLARFKVQKHQTKHVPRIIHQVYHNWQQYGNGSTMLPEWESQRQSCIERNPDWVYMVRSRWTSLCLHLLTATVCCSCGRKKRHASSSKPNSLGFSTHMTASDTLSRGNIPFDTFFYDITAASTLTSTM